MSLYFPDPTEVFRETLARKGDRVQNEISLVRSAGFPNFSILAPIILG